MQECVPKIARSFFQEEQDIGIFMSSLLLVWLVQDEKKKCMKQTKHFYKLALILTSGLGLCSSLFSLKMRDPDWLSRVPTLSGSLVAG